MHAPDRPTPRSPTLRCRSASCWLNAPIASKVARAPRLLLLRHAICCWFVECRELSPRRVTWRQSCQNRRLSNARERDKRAGKSASTQAGEFVREEINHIREGKHGARSSKQAIAIGLSKARRSGVELTPPRKGKTSERTRRSACARLLHADTERQRNGRARTRRSQAQ